MTQGSEVTTNPVARRPRAVTRRTRLFGGPVFWGTASVVFVLIIWWVITRAGLVSTFYLPSPETAVEALGRMIADGRLGANLAISAQRLVFGFLVGTLAGLIVGVATGWVRLIDWILTPFVSGAYTLPKLALLPLLILWMGIGETSKVFLISLGAFFPVLVNAYAGVRQTDRTLILAARNLGASGAGVIRKVVLPHSIPYLIAGLRLGFGQSLLLVVAAEMISSSSGLGFAILQASNLLDMSSVLALLFVFAALGVASTAAFRFAERRLAPWAAPQGEKK